MIYKIKTKGLKEFHESGSTKGIQADHKKTKQRYEMERKPSHPGELLLEEVMKPCGITVTAAAEALHVSRKQLSELVNQRCILTPEMAVRIGTWTRTSPEMWLGMQNTLSLWEARQQKRQPIQALAACKV